MENKETCFFFLVIELLHSFLFWMEKLCGEGINVVTQSKAKTSP
ncbi:hypothetical protein GLYMA_20G013450v4 [Glycine max]|nr:hypothetical protein GLYMA_20G013450v4 [Glycine max]KAH1034051.1 hypothetical protein GYH30_054452 [Glycine max]